MNEDYVPPDQVVVEKQDTERRLDLDRADPNPTRVKPDVSNNYVENPYFKEDYALYSEQLEAAGRDSIIG